MMMNDPKEKSLFIKKMGILAHKETCCAVTRLHIVLSIVKTTVTKVKTLKSVTQNGKVLWSKVETKTITV